MKVTIITSDREPERWVLELTEKEVVDVVSHFCVMEARVMPPDCQASGLDMFKSFTALIADDPRCQSEEAKHLFRVAPLIYHLIRAHIERGRTRG